MANEKAKERRKRKGERPDGLVPVTLTVGRKPDGSPDRKWFYGHSKTEAKKKRDEYKAKLAAGMNLDRDFTVEGWIEIFKATYRTKVNKAYIKNDDVPYNRLSKALGKMRVADVRESDLQTALNAVSGMSFSTVIKYLSAIKRVFRKARKNKLISDDPSEDLDRPLYTEGSFRALEEWEVECILSHWDNKYARTGLWIMLMLLCGLRRGEMMALRWENIDLEARTLDVCEVAVISGNQAEIEERAKSDAGLRTLPICKALYDSLCSVPADQRTGLVCLSAKGKQLSESAVSRGLEQFCTVIERILNDEPTDQQGRRKDIEEKRKAAGIVVACEPPKEKKTFSFRFHDLRYTYATALYDAGVPVKAAQYFLGHSDIKITLALYIQLSKERKMKSRLSLVKYLDKWIDRRLLSEVPYQVREGEDDMLVPGEGDFDV